MPFRLNERLIAEYQIEFDGVQTVDSMRVLA